MKQFTIFSIVTLVILSINLSAQSEKNTANREAVTGIQISDTVEDFTLTSTTGDRISLSQYDDAKGYIVVFTSNVCPFAIANEERLIEIHNETGPKGYPVIAINSNGGQEENLEAMKSKVDDINIPFAYLKDDSSLYEKFGAIKTPHVFLIDNTMTLRYTGSIDDSPRSAENVEETYLLNAVLALMENSTPNPAVTKSIGCPIKSTSGIKRKGRKGPPNFQALIESMDINEDNNISKN